MEEVNFVLTLSGLAELLEAAREREKGQAMAEYAVVLAVVTIAAAAAFTALSGGMQNALNQAIAIL